ncbi:MAG: DUF1015 family protein [Dehalococcoidia bacterium]
MPQILPFRGIRYTPRAGALSDLLAPPYDVISPAGQAALAARNEHNAVRLELAEGGEERYAQVAGLVKSWTDSGDIARDEAPMLYAYEQEFVEDGETFRRRALVAAVEAQPWEEGAILPHEYTMSGPKEDRLKLLQATGVQFSPIFMLARDRAGQLRQFLDETMASRPPDQEATKMDGDRHRLWLVEASRFEMRRIAPLLSETFTIADGHHRYETAATYKQWRLEADGALPRDHPARFTLTAIVAADDPGLVIRPIHRIVPRPAPSDWLGTLSAQFAIEPVVGDPGAAELAELVKNHPGFIIGLGLDGPGSKHWLVPMDAGAVAPSGHSETWASLGSNVLRYGVLEPLWGIGDDELRAGAVEFTHLAGEVLERVEAGGATGFLISPVSVADTLLLAEKHERMPQKSTFFHPKMGTGLVFYPLNP